MKREEIASSKSLSIKKRINTENMLGNAKYNHECLLAGLFSTNSELFSTVEL